MPEYGDYNRLEPKIQENIKIPEKIDKSVSDGKPEDPKTSAVSRAILSAPQTFLEEADSLVGRRLKKQDPSSEEVLGKAHAVGTPILLQADDEGDVMDLLHQEEAYAKQQVDLQMMIPEDVSPSAKRDFTSMNADELEKLLSQDLNDEDLNAVLQRLDELSTEVNEEIAYLNEEAVQIDGESVQIKENEAQLEVDGEQLQEVKEEVVAKKADTKQEIKQEEKQVVIEEKQVAAGEVRAVEQKTAISILADQLMVFEPERQEWVHFDPVRHKNVKEEDVVAFDRATGTVRVPPNSKYRLKAGQMMSCEGAQIPIKKVKTFTKEELAQMMAILSGQTFVLPDDEEKKGQGHHTAASPTRYREEEFSSRSPLHRRDGLPIQQERLSQTSASSYATSSKKFLDEALEKNYKKIQMELKRLDKEILSHEILIEEIKGDEQVQLVQKMTQQLQDLQTQNRAIDAKYDVALQKFLDGIKGYQGEVPLPIIKKFKEIQIELIRMDKLIPKEISGSKEMIKVLGNVVAMKKEVVTVMTGLITAAGKLYASGGNAERQPSRSLA